MKVMMIIIVCIQYTLKRPLPPLEERGGGRQKERERER